VNPKSFANTANHYIDYASQAQSAITKLGIGWNALGFGGGRSAENAKPDTKGKGKQRETVPGSTHTVSKSSVVVMSESEESEHKKYGEGEEGSSGVNWGVVGATAAGIGT
jgi:hypothetical protein